MTYVEKDCPLTHLYDHARIEVVLNLMFLFICSNQKYDLSLLTLVMLHPDNEISFEVDARAGKSGSPIKLYHTMQTVMSIECSILMRVAASL